MPSMKPLLVFFILSLVCYSIKAQNVCGSWYGVGHIQLEGSSENYLSELIIKKDGENLKGEFNYYFRDSLFKNKVKCSFNKKTRLLVIQKFPIIYFKSRSTKTAVMCDVKGIFELRVAKMESVLNGSLSSASDLNILMPVINYRLQKDTELTGSKKDKQKEIKSSEWEETNLTNNNISIKSEIVSTEKSSLIKDSTNKGNFTEKNIIPVSILTERAFNNRKKDYTQTIDVENTSIQLEVYDNGTIDYDSVSLLLNGKLILPKTMLTHKSVKLTIQLDEKLDYNELGMFAENLGLIPPNTAALIIRDGSKKYEVILNSDFNKNAVIQLRTNKRKDL